MRLLSMTPQRWLACAVIAAGMAGVGLTLAHSDLPLRAPLVLLFLAAAPAMAVAGLLRGLDTFGRVFAGAAAAVVINVLVAETMIAAGAWSPDHGLVAVVVITAVLGAARLLLRTRAGPRAPERPAGVGQVERP